MIPMHIQIACHNQQQRDATIYSHDESFTPSSWPPPDREWTAASSWTTKAAGSIGFCGCHLYSLRSILLSTDDRKSLYWMNVLSIDHLVSGNKYLNIRQKQKSSLSRHCTYSLTTSQSVNRRSAKGSLSILLAKWSTVDRNSPVCWRVV